ncbi:MAG: DUF1003 domain-containing protein [Gammaproteobacteria bacterium]|nr:DUF1003 domain-containing protein [Gammaproteobacteria bacterium]
MASITPGERVAKFIAAFCGSVNFVWLHVAWFGAWIILNLSSLFPFHPDPFPFTFLTLVVSLEAIFLSAFILISQNRETRIAERRSRLDLQINLLTEQENTTMLKMLVRIAEKIGADVDSDQVLSVLAASTRPGKLIDQIDNESNEATGSHLKNASTG